jgi:hypothetical protein
MGLRRLGDAQQKCEQNYDGEGFKKKSTSKTSAEMEK